MAVREPMPSIRGDQINLANEIRARGSDLVELLDQCGHSPELTQARLRLEEAMMWAVKHVMRG
jgi:hypothetical protein